MNNRFKFRVWLPNENRFVFPYCFAQIPSHRPVQQFTGLLDSKGKEIYEGDILKFISNISQVEAFYSAVTFEIGCFGYTQKIAPSESRFFNLSRWPANYGYRKEIVGNIFENPELLT